MQCLPVGDFSLFCASWKVFLTVVLPVANLVLEDDLHLIAAVTLLNGMVLGVPLQLCVFLPRGFARSFSDCWPPTSLIPH